MNDDTMERTRRISQYTKELIEVSYKAGLIAGTKGEAEYDFTEKAEIDDLPASTSNPIAKEQINNRLLAVLEGQMKAMIKKFKDYVAFHENPPPGNDGGSDINDVNEVADQLKLMQ